MTDNEIIKALECRALTGLRKIKKCGKCKYVKSDFCDIRKLIMDALDLIHRLQAENEKLQTIKKHIDTLIYRGCEYPTAEAYNEAFQKALERLCDNTNTKAEAVKEFAKKVNKMITEIYNKHIFCANDLNDEEKDAIINFSDDVTSGIENILKESVSDNNAK